MRSRPDLSLWKWAAFVWNRVLWETDCGAQTGANSVPATWSRNSVREKHSLFARSHSVHVQDDELIPGTVACKNMLNVVCTA